MSKHPNFTSNSTADDASGIGKMPFNPTRATDREKRLYYT